MALMNEIVKEQLHERIVDAILGAARDTHQLPVLRIIETGYQNTASIVKWVSKLNSEKPIVKFTTTDLDIIKQNEIHDVLEKQEISKYYVMHTQDHMKFLNEQKWVDIAFLYPEDLYAGLEEFKVAASIGVKIVVMMDYERRAAMAVSQAKRLGWTFEVADSYCVLVRPKNKGMML